MAWRYGIAISLKSTDGNVFNGPTNKCMIILIREEYFLEIFQMKQNWNLIPKNMMIYAVIKYRFLL